MVFTSCQRDMPAIQDDAAYYPDIPSFVPGPEIPLDNPLTKQRVKMGEKLFFDKRLSRDLSISCASCHRPDKAFADNKVRAVGIEGRVSVRNVPTLLNVAYAPRLLMDGGSPDLEAQVLVPIQSHKEMDMTLEKVVDRLSGDPVYKQLSKSAFGTEISQLVIIKALASYQRSIYSFNSPFDQYYYREESKALSAVERNGLKIFLSEKTNCTSCHVPPLFTNFSFQNNGLYPVYEDSGRGRITFSEADLGKFKVPTLRNIELTGPYMHDGSFSTLEQVVDHYNKGGHHHPNKNSVIKPLNLTEGEQKALVSFLKSLTDNSLKKKIE